MQLVWSLYSKEDGGGRPPFVRRDSDGRPIFIPGDPVLTRGLLFQIAGPTLFVSLLFLGSCITAALYLHHQQSASVRILDEAIASRKVAGELLKALDDLLALPAARSD